MNPDAESEKRIANMRTRGVWCVKGHAAICDNLCHMTRVCKHEHLEEILLSAKGKEALKNPKLK